MRKSHVFVLAALIALGATFGTYALTRTTELGVKAREASTKDVDAVVAARTRQLNALEISLHTALAKKPPKLPALPPKVKAAPVQVAPRAYSAAPVTSAPVATSRPAASAPVVRQVKLTPAPTPTYHGEHGDSSSGGGQDD